MVRIKKILAVAVAFVMMFAAVAVAPVYGDAGGQISRVTVTFNGNASTSRGFTWYTQANVTGSDLQVVLKVGTTLPDFAGAYKFKGTSGQASSGEMWHRAVASNLKPDTEYYYRVGDESAGVWSSAGSFRTTVEGAFTFISLSDTQAADGEGYDVSANTLMQAMNAVPKAQFIVHSGDIVKNAVDESQWKSFLDKSASTLMNTTIVPAAGEQDKDANAFIKHFNIKEADGSDTASGAYYSFDYGNVHFIVMNTNESSANYACFSEEQVNWLKKDIADAKTNGSQWIIANMHKGPYTAGQHASDDEIAGAKGIRAQIAPFLEDLGVDVVLQGHDRYPSRTKALNHGMSSTALSPGESVYVNTGAAGPEGYGKNMSLSGTYMSLFTYTSPAISPAYKSAQYFMSVTIDDRTLTGQMYQISNASTVPVVVDTFVITKNLNKVVSPAVTRAEFIEKLASAHGAIVTKPLYSSFADVEVNDSFAPYTQWAYDNKLLMGNGSKMMLPYDRINYETAAVVMMRYVENVRGIKLSSLGVTDTSSFLKMIGDYGLIDTSNAKAYVLEENVPTMISALMRILSSVY